MSFGNSDALPVRFEVNTLPAATNHLYDEVSNLPQQVSTAASGVIKTAGANIQKVKTEEQKNEGAPKVQTQKFCKSIHSRRLEAMAFGDWI